MYQRTKKEKENVSGDFCRQNIREMKISVRKIVSDSPANNTHQSEKSKKFPLRRWGYFKKESHFQTFFLARDHIWSPLIMRFFFEEWDFSIFFSQKTKKLRSVFGFFPRFFETFAAPGQRNAVQMVPYFIWPYRPTTMSQACFGSIRMWFETFFDRYGLPCHFSISTKIDLQNHQSGQDSEVVSAKIAALGHLFHIFRISGGHTGRPPCHRLPLGP